MSCMHHLHLAFFFLSFFSLTNRSIVTASQQWIAQAETLRGSRLLLMVALVRCFDLMNGKVSSIGLLFVSLLFSRL